MALVTVRFCSLWRLYLGVDRISLEADDLEEALAQTEERFGCRLREKLQAHGIQLGGKMQDYSLVLLNGISVRNLEQTKLREGDTLHIFPPAAGG